MTDGNRFGVGWLLAVVKTARPTALFGKDLPLVIIPLVVGTAGCLLTVNLLLFIELRSQLLMDTFQVSRMLIISVEIGSASILGILNGLLISRICDDAMEKRK